MEPVPLTQETPALGLSESATVDAVLSAFTLEQQLVIATAGMNATAAAGERIRALAAVQSNWGEVTSVAVQQRTFPLLQEHLTRYAADLVPDAVLDDFCKRRRRNVAQNLRMTAELGAVLDVLAAASLPSLTFKGPTLAVLAYGHVGMREFSDVDLLVRQEDVDQVLRALRQSGYCPKSDLAQDKLNHLVHTMGQIQLVGESGVLIEVHSKLTREHLYFPLAFDELWVRRQIVDVAGYELATFGNEDLLLYLTVHGAKHIWPCLGWVADCAHLINASNAFDWQTVTKRARETRSETMLLLACSLVDQFSLLDLPEWLVSACRSKPAVGSLERFVTKRMYCTTPISRPSIAWYSYYVRERRWDALRYLWYKAFVAHHSDWDAVSLPRPFSFLYPLLRPPRLLYNEISRLLRKE